MGIRGRSRESPTHSSEPEPEQPGPIHRLEIRYGRGDDDDRSSGGSFVRGQMVGFQTHGRPTWARSPPPEIGWRAPCHSTSVLSDRRRSTGHHPRSTPYDGGDLSTPDGGGGAVGRPPPACALVSETRRVDLSSHQIHYAPPTALRPPGTPKVTGQLFLPEDRVVFGHQRFLL